MSLSEHCHSGHKREHRDAKGSPNIMLVLRRVIWGSKRRGNTAIIIIFFLLPEQIFCLAAAQTAITAHDNNPWHSRTKNIKKEPIVEIK